MKNRFFYIIIWAVGLSMLATACADNDIVVDNAANGNTEPLTGIVAVIGGNASRADVPLTDPDYIGRKDFANGDRLMFTTIKRTENPIPDYSYTGIEWVRADDSWSRDIKGGEAERIYWSDAMSGHTFTGYSLPRMPAERVFDWQKIGENYYYGSLGNFDNAEEGIIDYSSKYTAEGEILPADSGSIKLRYDDLVLTNSTDMRAQPGGSIALVEFRHALSNILIVVNINGFAAESTAEDAKALVTDMKLPGQPFHYKWNMASDKVEPLDATDAANVSGWNAEKTLRACIFKPSGSNSGRYRQFTFSTLAVPTNADGRDMTFSFKVTYPDPMKPNTGFITKNYIARLNGVKLYAGKRTQINITLEHTDEKMTVGAEYIDWEFTHTPDEIGLKKKSTFLTSTNRNTVTIHSDADATADDATWLYKEGSEIYDIYGHTGDSSSDAYTISTAQQLLSFAYEVNEGGWDFEGKYVKLDAGLTLQSSLSIKPEDSGVVSWIGIGTDATPFNGSFLGYSRKINCLYGKPLFIATGEKAFIEYISLNKVLGISGGGAVVETNGGILGACIIEGDIVGTEPYCGSITAHNLPTGYILSCVHIGTAEGPDYVGGLAGKNEGHIVACYHSGSVIANDGSHVSGTVASNTGYIQGVYFNIDYLLNNGLGGCNTAELQSKSFVDDINAAKLDFVNSGTTGLGEQLLEHYRTNHDFFYRPAAYPYPK